VLFLDPSEDGFLKRLKQKRVPVEEIRIRQNKQQSIKGQLQNMCFRDPELKYLGQKAFISYARSIHTQHDKEVFQLQELPMEDYAASLGLPGTPHIKFQSGANAKQLKNAQRMPISSESEDGKDQGKKTGARTRYDRMFERVNQDVLAPHYANLVEDGGVTRSGEDSEG
jgi:ATP-dependent RNA helicase DDX10/DBP4